MPRILAVSGWKNAGKTSLCMELARELQERGYRIGYLKHSSHHIASGEESDSGKARQLGMTSVFFSSGTVLVEPRDMPSPEYLAAQWFPEEDLVLLEGAKKTPLPRIWVGNPREIPEEVKGVLACWNREGAENEGEGDISSRTFVPGELKKLGDYLEGTVLRKDPEPLEVFVQQKRLPVKTFVGDFLRGGILGMLDSLKGYSRSESASVSLFLRGGEEAEDSESM